MEDIDKLLNDGKTEIHIDCTDEESCVFVDTDYQIWLDKSGHKNHLIVTKTESHE